MSVARLAVLDNVALAQGEQHLGDPLRVTVVQVRRYSEGEYRYVVTGELFGNSDLHGIYDDEALGEVFGRARPDDFVDRCGTGPGQEVRLMNSVSEPGEKVIESGTVGLLMGAAASIH